MSLTDHLGVWTPPGALFPTEFALPRQLSRMRAGEMSPNELRQWLKVRYEVAHFFDPTLEAILKGLEEKGSTKENLIGVIRGNLKEEQGQAANAYGNVSHAEARNQLLTALDLPQHDSDRFGTWEHPKNLDPRAYNWVMAMKRLVADTPLGGAAGMAYWETRVGQENGDWPILLKALEKSFPELVRSSYRPGDALWHIASHAQMDGEHGSSLRTAVEESLGNEQQWRLAKRGVETVATCFDRFWACDTLTHS